MKPIVVALLAAGLAAGCASSAEIQRGANAHLARAQAYEASGDYYRAAKEREAANKQFAKASQRAYEETYGHYYW